MRITAYYQTGKITEFNAETFTTSEPFKGDAEGANITTEFNLRLDQLRENGLILEVFWYNAIKDQYAAVTEDEDSGRVIYHAGREPGRIVRLVSSSELQDIVKICVDGEMVVWNQGGEIVNGIRFTNQEILCYSDEVTRSINSKALLLFDYLRKANPVATDEELARMIGYSHKAFEHVRDMELAQVDELSEEITQDEDTDLNEEPSPVSGLDLLRMSSNEEGDY